MARRRVGNPPIRSGVPKGAVAANLRRVAADLPGFFQKRQERIDLRHSVVQHMRARQLEYEHNKLLEHYLGLMGPHARAEDLRGRARTAAAAEIRRIYPRD